MRFFGIDVHLEFCEVAVAEGGKVSQVGRIASTPEAIREFARDLGSDDQVVLDASGSVMAIARILRESNVGRVIVSNAAQTRAISHARVKSDRFDAAMLARLLSAGCSVRYGCRTRRRSRYAAVSRGARLWCGHARGSRTRCTP